MPEVTSGYASVNGLRLHYQRSGTGSLMRVNALIRRLVGADR